MNINILDDRQSDALRQLINDAEHIVICCHQNPDGDALGSSLGLADYLRSLGKMVLVTVPNMFPDFLRWLPGTERIMRYDKFPSVVREQCEKADLIFCLDFNTLERIDRLGEAVGASKAKRILIDHHPGPNIETAMTISYPEMSSTCELVFRVLWQLGAFPQITRQCATHLYCGMMTDTGGFTYNSNNPEIFFIISQLLTKGIDKDKIYRNVYNNYSESRLRLMGYVMYEKMRYFPEKHAAYFTIDRNDFRRFHFIKGDAEGLVNIPLQIKGTVLSISLREDSEQDNLIWVSLRSVDNTNCTEIAMRFFNGGGHMNASGGRLYCSMEEAEKIAREAIASL